MNTKEFQLSVKFKTGESLKFMLENKIGEKV